MLAPIFRSGIRCCLGSMKPLKMAAILTAILDFTENSDSGKKATAAKFAKLCLGNSEEVLA